MTERVALADIVFFTKSQIELMAGGGFECTLSIASNDSDLSLSIDIYDLDNAVHPEGHLGW